MSGFTLKCKDCGNEVELEQDVESVNEKVSIYTDLMLEGTYKQYIRKTVWCEKCDNSAKLY